jgi:hypothetical protein
MTKTTAAGTVRRIQPKTRPAERWRIAPGLADVLAAVIESKLDAHVAKWKEEIAAGVIGSETRAVITAMGWTTSLADTRLEPLSDGSASSDPSNGGEL